jgi:hypothetical protein
MGMPPWQYIHPQILGSILSGPVRFYPCLYWVSVINRLVACPKQSYLYPV